MGGRGSSSGIKAKGAGGAADAREVTGSETDIVDYMLTHSPNGNFSEAEGDALEMYHYGNAVLMNNDLRSGGDGQAGGFTKDTLQSLDSAISKSALKEDTVLYRGIASKNFLGLDLSSPEKAVGRTVTDKGYGSTSISKEVSSTYGKGTVLRIRAKKGTHATYVEGAIHKANELREFAADGDAGNHELLLGRRTKYKITGYHREGSNVIYDCSIK